MTMNARQPQKRLTSRPRTAQAARVLALGLALGALAATAHAQEQDSKVQFHGFGGWAYAQTDGNGYLLGSEDGNYDNLSLALNVNAQVNERLTVVGQFELAQQAGYAEEEEHIDFAFAEWKFNDALRFRAGRVKHPWGIYGEIFNVGTLRPFYMLPQSIYGPERFTAKAVDGIGFTGSHSVKGWGLSYDVYGGRIGGDFRISGAQYVEDETLQLGLYEAPFGFDEVVGARLNVQPPVAGLMFGVSSYRGEGTGLFGGSTEKALGAHAEYQTGPLQLRAEYGTIFGNPITRFDCFYAEGAVTVKKGLQLAVRYDIWEGHVKDPQLYVTYGMPWILKIQDSHDFAVGVNYWFNPGFVLKVDYHTVRGNRFAHPTVADELKAIAGSNQIRRDTGMVVAGAQFSF